MEYKKTILVLLIVFLFLLFGCPGTNPVCGNEVCEFSEDDSSSSVYCPLDCGINLSVCGDGVCDKGEDEVNCPQDCKQIQTCSNIGGIICKETQDCNGDWINGTLDSNFCCSKNCINPGVLETCNAQNGVACDLYLQNSLCEGEWIASSDTDFCCSSSCYADCTIPLESYSLDLKDKVDSKSFFINQIGDEKNKVEKIIKNNEPVFLFKFDNKLLSLTEIKESYPTIDASANIYIVELSAEPLLDYLNSNSIYKQFETQLVANGYSPLSSQIKSIVSSQKAVLANNANLVMNQIALKYPSTKKLNSYYWVFNGFSVKLPNNSALLELKKIPGVKNVYSSGVAKATMNDVNTLLSLESVWQMQDSVSQNITGKGIKVGVIDTGVDYTHPDFGSCTKEAFIRGACEKIAGGYDFVNNDNDPIDDYGHGTHVAGIIAANGTAGGSAFKGIAPEAKVYALKVLNSSGSGSYEGILAAIDWSIDPNNDNDNSDHLDVINLSLGGAGTPDDALSKAIDKASENGVISVVAAGNYYSHNSIGTPGSARTAITVGATFDKNYLGNYWGAIDPVVDEVTPFSSRGPVIWGNDILFKPDIVAPGALICSSRFDSIYPEGSNEYYKPCIDNKHVLLAGTSMATPVVAGIAALVKQANPKMGVNEIKSLIVSTGKKAITNSGSSFYKGVEFSTGAGRASVIDALNAELTFNPTSLNLGLKKKADEFSNTSFLIKNNSGQSLGVKFIDKEGEYYFGLSEICLLPNQTKLVDVNVMLNENYGAYSGAMTIESSYSCDLEVNSKKYAIPYTYLKAKVLDLTVKLKKDNPDQNNGFIIAAVYGENPSFYVSTGFVNITNLVDGFEYKTSLVLFTDNNFADVLVTQNFNDNMNLYKNTSVNHYTKGIDLTENGASVVIDMHETIKLNNNISEFINDGLNTATLNYEDPVVIMLFSDVHTVCDDQLSQIKFYVKTQNSRFPFDRVVSQVVELKNNDRPFKFVNKISLMKYDYPYDYAGQIISINPNQLKESKLNLAKVLNNNEKTANLGLNIVPKNWTTFWTALPIINVPQSILLRMPDNENSVNNIQYQEWPYDNQYFLTSYYNGTNYIRKTGASPDINIIQFPLRVVFSNGFDNNPNNLYLSFVESSSSIPLNFMDKSAEGIKVTKPDGEQIFESFKTISSIFGYIFCGNQSYPKGLSDCQNGEYIFDINLSDSIVGAKGIVFSLRASYDQQNNAWVIPGEFKKPFCGNNSVIGGLINNGWESGVIFQDLELMKDILAGDIPLPENICCIDADNDKKFTQNDVDLANNFLNKSGSFGNIGKICSEVN